MARKIRRKRKRAKFRWERGKGKEIKKEEAKED